MKSPTIPLDRRFFEWRDSESGLADSSFRTAAGLDDGSLGWADLLAKRRVVILAEAGSGKTEELTEQARLQAAAGKFAFYATVQDVGRDGLERALRSAERARFTAWRASDQPGWFFIDSIDEAKLDNVRLERALHNVATAIEGAEGRAHVVLSGRHTDWEFTRDSRRLSEELPLPNERRAEPLPSLDTLIHRVLNHETAPEPTPPETPLIVVMAPLDRDRIRTYATARNTLNLEGLMAAIEAANMWTFARRPLDLDWIVRYWRSHDRLGSYKEMIEASLRERLREVDPERSRRDGLDAERALRGLERIGAALVFGRKTTIAIPDNEVDLSEAQGAITIDDVLPDWSPEDRRHLLTRPAFDPATFGRARLHNDNEGVVRAYLTARWLHRLGQANLPRQRLHDLLFSRTHEIDLVKPSMLETAAWLSLWDESVAKEVIRRAPYLLLTAGDPASLPSPTRQAVLMSLVEQMRRGERIPHLELSSLTRFAQPDIAPVLRAIWETDKANVDIRMFILRLIWLGKLQSCADLADESSFGRYEDRYTAIFSGRALIDAGDDRQRSEYARYIVQQCAAISPTIVCDAVEELFPRLIDIDDLLAILAAIRLGDAEGGGFNLEWNGPELVAKLSTVDELTRLIEGILKQLDSNARGHDDDHQPSQLSHYATTLAAAAQALLSLSPPNVAPVAAIDAVIRIGEWGADMPRPRHKTRAGAIEQLHATPARRRAAFWRAAEQLGNHRMLGGRPLLNLFQMSHFGWPPGLVLEDIDWLLVDGPQRAVASERQLAMNAALNLWVTVGDNDEAMQRRIAAVAATDAGMNEVYLESVTPRVKSPAEIKSEKDLAKAMHAGERKRSKDEQSWVEFIEQVRADPERLRQPQPVTATRVDSRLFNLWSLLHQANSKDSRYAIESVAAISEIAGGDVAEAFAEGMSKVWRSRKPTLRSARPPDERNQVSSIDVMGLAAVSIEAASRQNWATLLSEDEAVRAAEYATLEINGFPAWLGALATIWPCAVEGVLAREIASDLDNPKPGIHYQTLEDISRGGDELVRLMSASLLRELEARPDLNQLALKPMLPSLRRGLPEASRLRLYALVLERFKSLGDPQLCAQYLGVAYAIDARGATDALVAKLDGLDEQAKTKLVERVLPQIFGSRWSRWEPPGEMIDTTTLERLVALAYRTVRLEEDRDRANKGVYSPDERDDAQDARSAALNTLVSRPGRATFDAIHRLMETPGFPIPAVHMQAHAEKRAAEDAEQAAWTADEPRKFEELLERPPGTTRELQLVALQRLEELQHDLVHGDFQQGTTLSGLPNEQAVQNWVADRLRQVQRTAYSIEREVHVADEKEPDLRFRAKASDASVAAEIKVAASWTLAELQDALENQLCNQYLRARDGREGIFLLVHQAPRPKGWELPDGTFVDFEELVRRLQEQAARIRQASPAGPQPEVCVLDVSSCAQPVRSRKPRKTLTSKKAASPGSGRRITSHRAPGKSK